MSDQVTLTCPSCGRPMAERENRQNGSRVGKKAAGRRLDGVEWSQYPVPSERSR